MGSKPKIVPLPYSAFPAELAGDLGAVTVAFQRIEDGVSELIKDICDLDPAITNVFLKRIRSLGVQLETLQDLAKVVSDESEQVRIGKLRDYVQEVAMERNKLVHSVAHGYNKQTGEVLQVKDGGAGADWYSAARFETLINRMYLVIEAFDQRHYGVEGWDRPFENWEQPEKFWDDA